jgi:hypothetical protein
LNQVTFALLLVSIVPLAALGFWLTVRARRKKQELVIAQPPAPSRSQPGPALTTPALESYYLATTFRDNPLERVWAHRLGGRGKAWVAVGEAVEIWRVGEPGIRIEKADLLQLEAASATIDRGVEAGGITNLHWNLGQTEVITSLRFVSRVNRDEFEKAVGVLIDQ